MQRSQELFMGEAIQEPVGPSAIVIVQVDVEFLFWLVDTGRQGSGVKLVPEGAPHPFNLAVQLGASGRGTARRAQFLGVDRLPQPPT